MRDIVCILKVEVTIEQVSKDYLLTGRLEEGLFQIILPASISPNIHGHNAMQADPNLGQRAPGGIYQYRFGIYIFGMNEDRAKPGAIKIYFLQNIRRKDNRLADHFFSNVVLLHYFSHILLGGG